MFGQVLRTTRRACRRPPRHRCGSPVHVGVALRAVGVAEVVPDAGLKSVSLPAQRTDV